MINIRCANHRVSSGGTPTLPFGGMGVAVYPYLFSLGLG